MHKIVIASVVYNKIEFRDKKQFSFWFITNKKKNKEVSISSEWIGFGINIYDSKF